MENKKLKIAQIAPLIERVPPKKYGGTERVAHALVEELVLRGHEVTLYASGDSITSAKLISVVPRSLRETKTVAETDIATVFNIGLAYRDQKSYDIIHDHTGYLSLPTANLATTPVVMTAHGPFTTQNRRIFETLNRPRIVAISESQKRSEPKIDFAGVVYNGLPMDSYPFSETDDGYLIFVGRISPEKGIHHAIEVAQYLNMPLVIAAKLDIVDREYFKRYVEPHLSDEIRWIGEVSETDRNVLMSRARCFLNPITWREPFGLTMIEAQACGCPVIAFSRGSAPELIEHGKTGFIVEGVEDMIDAVLQAGSIDRNACRDHALKNFNAKIMAEKYEAVYYKILENKKGE